MTTQPEQVPEQVPVDGAISLTVIDGDSDHFMVTFDRPGRIEVARFSTGFVKVLAHVYEGTEIDMDQRPLFAYDGTLHDNEDVTR